MSDAEQTGKAASITTIADAASLGVLLTFIDGVCAHAGIAGTLRHDLRLAVEEVCTNVIHHGYPADQPGPLRLEFRERPGHYEVTLEDRAAAFDPASAPAADRSSEWDERGLGGQGWHLVRSVMDEVRYQRTADGANRVTLVKLKPQAEGGQ